DNCSTNKKIASLNLAVNDLINSSSALVNNATRWMSTMKMIERCKELIPHITQANGFLARDILLIELNINEVNNNINQLQYFFEVTNDLQNESMNLDDVRAYFDLLIEECPSLKNRIGKNAPIVHDFVFEEAVIKVLRKQETVLTPAEKQKL
ncbi:24596_t:CDS:2, partial [Gigaspora rosea]